MKKIIYENKLYKKYFNYKKYDKTTYIINKNNLRKYTV